MERAILLVIALALAACSDGSGPSSPPLTDLVACGGESIAGPALAPSPPPLSVLGQGFLADRYTAELWVRGNTAYTSSWGLRNSSGQGNEILVWDVSGDVPAPLGCVTLQGATTTGDVQVSDDGRLLAVATERTNGSFALYDVATDPRRPRLLSRYRSANTTNGVHTAEVARVGGKLYGFLSIDPIPARLTILDLSDPAHPAEVLSRIMGQPFVHDVYVRDGILFTALWDAGMTIWDIGGGGLGGSVADPVQIGNVVTVGGRAHNIFWFHDPQGGSSRYAFVGEEQPSSGFASSGGDIHVVDVSDMANPREVAFYNVPGAGTHNFSVDEASGVLYAAYYNAGVRALDIRGDLGTCTAAQQTLNDGRCDLRAMGRELAAGPRDTFIPVFIWGVFYDGASVYASDMLNGLWKLTPVVR